MKSGWYKFENYQTDLTDLKNYVSIIYNIIDPILIVKFHINNNSEFDGGMIKITNQNYSYIPLIIKSNYTLSIFELIDYSKNVKIKTRRLDKTFIINQNICRLIDNLFNEIKDELIN